MHRIAGENPAAAPIAVGQQQVLPPLADIEHVVLDRHGDRLFEHGRHIGVGFHHRMQREVPGRILHDQERRLRIGHVIVPAFADRDALVKLFAVIERLPQLEKVAVALQGDAELPPHDARPAVAADEVLGLDLGRLVPAFDRCRDRARILRERKKLAAVADLHRREFFHDRLQQRLERVLRNELIGLERLAAVVARRDQRFRFGDRRIGKMQKRRLDQRQHDEHVHRTMARQAGLANAIHNSDAPVDLHRAGIAALHLGQELRRVFLLDDRASHAAASEIDGKRQARGTGADDENLGIHARRAPLA